MPFELNAFNRHATTIEIEIQKITALFGIDEKTYATSTISFDSTSFKTTRHGTIEFLELSAVGHPVCRWTIKS